MTTKVCSTLLPTYLKFFLQEEIPVKFYYKRQRYPSVPEVEPEKNSFYLEESSVFDVTGTPLEIDLKESLPVVDDTDAEIDLTLLRLDQIRNIKWTVEESRHLPYTSSELEFHLDELSDKDADGNYHLTLCDASDSELTVIQGGAKIENQFVNILVEMLPPCAEGDKLTTVPHLRLEHDQEWFGNGHRKDRDAKESTKVTKWYYLHGTDMKNCTNLDSYPDLGSVCIVQTEENDFYGKATHQAKFQLMMQRSVGHKNSALHAFWTELCFIHSLMETLNDCDETTQLSQELYDDFDVHEALMDTLLAGYKRTFETLCEPSQTIDFDQLRSMRIFDRLWCVLKRCSNLSELRDVWNYLFTELFERELKLDASEDDSVAAKLIADLSNKKIAPIELDLLGSLKMLIDLGLDKLKRDYDAMLEHYKLEGLKVDNVWRSLQEDERNKYDCHRTTMKFSSVDIDPKGPKKKIVYLKNMHVAVDFMLLMKTEKLNLGDDLLYDAIEIISNTYLNGTVADPSRFEDLSKTKLYEISVHVNKVDFLKLSEKIPNSWRIQITTRGTTYEFTSAYCFSYESMFPEELCRNLPVLSMDAETNVQIQCVKVVKSAMLLPF